MTSVGTSMIFRSLVKSVSEERLIPVVVRLGAPHHALAPPILDDARMGFAARPVKAVKWSEGISTNRIGHGCRRVLAETVEHLIGWPPGLAASSP